MTSAVLSHVGKVCKDPQWSCKKATRVSKRLEGGEQMRLEKKATMENAKEQDAILGKNAERILKI